ncbi:MAG: phage tail sheath C-terminal domain-containing protein [Bacteroidota bacterium]
MATFFSCVLLFKAKREFQLYVGALHLATAKSPDNPYACDTLRVKNKRSAKQQNPNAGPNPLRPSREMLHYRLQTALSSMKPISLSILLSLLFALAFGQRSSSAPASGVAQVETAIPAIIGYTKIAPNSTRPVLLKSYAAYERQFGGATANYYLAESVQLFFQNGGEKCYVISVGKTSRPIQKQALLNGLSISKKMSVQLLLVPDAVALNESDFYAVQNSMMSICGLMKDRFAILNTRSPSGNSTQDFQAFRAHTSGSNLSHAAVYYPWLVSTSGTSVPPAGAMAGIYASKDRKEGVWKAPANVQVQGISGLSHPLSTAAQNAAATHASGKSINPIVAMPSKGILVWGSRTLAGNDNEWRYVPVRRFAIMVEQSLEKGLSWAVFEPNNANTWAQVEAFCEAYLRQLYRQGALQGAKQDHAFYVKCGLNETMTNNDINQNRMNIEIGMAVVRPAEFLILRLELKMQ